MTYQETKLAKQAKEAAEQAAAERLEMLHADGRGMGTKPHRRGFEINPWHRILRSRWGQEIISVKTILELARS